MPTRDVTAPTVIRFVEEEIIGLFGPPEEILSDNGTCFTTASLVLFMTNNGIKWRTVLAYTLVSNGRAESIVLTLKYGIGKVSGGEDWAEALHKCVWVPLQTRTQLSGSL